MKGSPSGVCPVASSVLVGNPVSDCPRGLTQRYRGRCNVSTTSSPAFSSTRDTAWLRAAADLLGVDARRAAVSSRYPDHTRFDRASVGEHQPDRAHGRRHRGLDRLDARFAEHRGVPVAGRGEADGVVGAALDQHFGSARPGVCHRRRPMARAPAAQDARRPELTSKRVPAAVRPWPTGICLGSSAPTSREPDDPTQARKRLKVGGGWQGTCSRRRWSCGSALDPMRSRRASAACPANVLLPDRTLFRAACDASNSRLAADRVR